MDADDSTEPLKAVWSEEETTQVVLATAQLAVDGSIPVLDAVNKLKINLSEGVEGGNCTKDRWKSIYASAIWILGTQVSPCLLQRRCKVNPTLVRRYLLKRRGRIFLERILLIW